MFYKNRPKVKIEKTEWDRLIDWITVSLLVVYVIYIYMHYQKLPDTIPTHFGEGGIADNFGSKNSIWMLPFIAFLTTIGMQILIKFPHQHNYMVKITEENAPRLYQFATKIIRITTLFMVLLFFYISYAIIKATNNIEEDALGSWFLPTIITFSVTLTLYIIIKMNALK